MPGKTIFKKNPPKTLRPTWFLRRFVQQRNSNECEWRGFACDTKVCYSSVLVHVLVLVSGRGSPTRAMVSSVLAHSNKFRCLLYCAHFSHMAGSNRQHLRECRPKHTHPPGSVDAGWSCRHVRGTGTAHRCCVPPEMQCFPAKTLTARC